MPLMFGTMPSPGVSGTTNYNDLAQSYGGSAPTSPGGSFAPTPAPTEPQVYLGTGLYGDPFAGDDFKITKTGYDAYKARNEYTKVAGISKAIRKFDNMNFAQQRKMLRLLAIGGFAGAIAPEDIDEAVAEASQQDARSAYQALLETASDYYMSTGALVTPNDVLRSAIAYRLQGMGVSWNGKFSAFDNGISKAMEKQMSEGGGGSLAGPTVPKPGTYTTTQTSTDILNPQDAKALTRAMLQQELGRDPTQAEYEDFLGAINAAEHENPATQTTTTKYVLDKNDNLRVASSNTETDMGIGAEGLGQLAYEKARRQPGWAEWQAMGTYAPALFQALGAAVPGA